MSAIAIIPARGGSKRIPQKNIKPFLGKPIISYSIEAAINSKLFDEIMVSTDDNEIAEIALKYGAKIPFLRSKETANDHAGLSDVIIEVIKKYQEKNIIFENICCLLATAPFITNNILVEFLNKLNKGNFDSIFPVVRYSYPIQRALQFDNNKIKMIWPDNLEKRSQDLEPSFHDAGLFYWIKSEVLLKENRLWTNNTTAIEISAQVAQDIDTIKDWELAEMKYKLINEK